MKFFTERLRPEGPHEAMHGPGYTDLMNTYGVHSETGAAWNRAADIYEQGEAEDVTFLRSGGNSLMAPERRILGDLGPWCQRAIHLQCAGGVRTRSRS